MQSVNLGWLVGGNKEIDVAAEVVQDGDGGFRIASVKDSMSILPKRLKDRKPQMNIVNYN